MSPIIHFELPVSDRERAVDFYSKVFGWEGKMYGEELGNYVVVMTTESDEKGPKKSGAINGGFFPRSDQNPMQYPSVVVGVENIEEYMEKVKAAGGKVVGGIMDIPDVGRYIPFVDSEGNMLSMIQTKPM